MAIKITQEDGSEVTFDTVEEYEAVIKVQEELDRFIGKQREFDVEPKFSVGDTVKIVEDKSDGHPTGSTGTVVGEPEWYEEEGYYNYEVRAVSGSPWDGRTMLHDESELVSAEESPEGAGFDGKSIALKIGEEFVESFAKKAEEDEPTLKVGDKVRLTDDLKPVTVNAEIGAIGEIVGEAPFSKRPSVDFSGCTPIHSQIADPSQLELVEPIAQDVNGEDLYEGDLVTGINDYEYYFTDSKAIMEVTEDGNPRRVGEIKVSVVKHVNEKFDGLTARVNPEYFVKTTEEDYYKKHNPVIEVGSKVIALKDGCDITEGVVYTVNRIDTDGDYSFMDDETETNYFNHEENGITFRLATDEEIADAECVDSEPKFKDGDKVRVVGNNNPITHHRKIGCEGEVKKVMPNKYGSKGHGYEFYPDDTTLANQTIGEADLELVTDSKDFQDGDIVYVNEEFADLLGCVAEEGLYEVVVGLSGNRFVKQPLSLGMNVHGNEDKLTLVCRAEDRLDAEKF